jgi:serine/threonine protein kinase
MRVANNDKLKEQKIYNNVLNESSICTIVRVSKTIIEKRFASSKNNGKNVDHNKNLSNAYIDNEIDITKKLSNVKDLESRVPLFLDSYVDYEHDSKNQKIIKNNDDGITVMRLKYIKGVDLATFLKNVNNMRWSQSIKLLINIATKLIDCILMLHKNNIYHRDIKPSNIIIVKDKNKDGKRDYYDVKTMVGLRVIVIDFGFSVDMENMSTDLGNCVNCDMGTLGFVHIDFIRRGMKNRERGIVELLDRVSLMYADTFALGVTLFLMFNRLRFPHEKKTGERLSYSHCSNIAIDTLIERMISNRKYNQPPMSDALKIFQNIAM